MKRIIVIGTLAATAMLLTSNTMMAIEIGASDDTWVREDNPTSNRNGNSEVNARTDIDGDDNDVILLRFPTDSLSGEALSASLTLYWQRDDSGTGNSLTLWGLNESDSDETLWAEAEVTYDTAPGMIPDGLDPTEETALGHDDNDIRDLDAANLTLLVENQPYGPQVLDEAYSFSSDALTAFINADSNGEVSFLITRGELRTSGNQARFWPKESGISPMLDVEVVPEPTALALLALGGVALGFWRRK
jgi:hypothetical protein